MRRLRHRLCPVSFDGELEDRLLLHRPAVAAELHILEHHSSARPVVPLTVSINGINANFASFSQLVTLYVNVLFNFSGSFPSPGISGATSSNPDATLFLSSNYDQSITLITNVLNQSVSINVSTAPVGPGTAAAISARLVGSSPGSLVSQLTAIPVSSLASQGQSSSSAMAAAFIPIAQAINSAQSDVIGLLIQGAHPAMHRRPPHR